MARRVTTARDQVEMLSPWRTASPANGYDLMRDSMFKRLNREYHAWYEGNGDPRLESGGNGPLSSWRNIENFLRDNYPESHRGLNAGMESVGGLLDGGTVKDLPGYETGPDAEALHGYDPREVTATMLLLHNLSHGNRDDRYDLDVDRLAEIARIRSEMQRAHEQRTSSWRNTPDRPPTPIPPRDLLPHRQLNPAIMTPQDMQQSLYYPVYDESVPAPPPNPNRQYSDDPRIKGASRRRRTASTLFDWRRSPEYDSPGITVDHHSAPLENGDRLHAYRMDVSTPHWVFEIGPHDMPNRFPLRWIPGHLVPEGFSHTTYGMVIGRDPEVDPPGTDRRRRNNSLWGRYLDDPTHPSGKRHENGETYRTLAEAAEAAERRYLEEAPGWGQREPHRRGGFGYDAFFDRGLGGGNPGDGYSDVDEFPEEIP